MYPSLTFARTALQAQIFKMRGKQRKRVYYVWGVQGRTKECRVWAEDRGASERLVAHPSPRMKSQEKGQAQHDPILLVSVQPPLHNQGLPGRKVASTCFRVSVVTPSIRRAISVEKSIRIEYEVEEDASEWHSRGISKRSWPDRLGTGTLRHPSLSVSHHLHRRIEESPATLFQFSG